MNKTACSPLVLLSKQVAYQAQAQPLWDKTSDAQWFPGCQQCPQLLPASRKLESCPIQDDTSAGLCYIYVHYKWSILGHWHPSSLVSVLPCVCLGQPAGDHLHLPAVPGHLPHPCLSGSIFRFYTALTQGYAASLHPRREVRAWPEGAHGVGGERTRYREAELNGCPVSVRANRNTQLRSSTWWACGCSSAARWTPPLERLGRYLPANSSLELLSSGNQADCQAYLNLSLTA